jgi:hypothetical protein
MRALETFREIFWEAKRAPERNATLTRNPYRREFLLKKLYGKTKEERKASKAAFAESLKAHEQQIEHGIINDDLQVQEEQKERSSKRRDIAKRREKLGFADGGAEEMDDMELEHYEHVVATHERKIDV